MGYVRILSVSAPAGRMTKSGVLDDCEAQRKPSSVKAQRNQLSFYPRVLCSLSISLLSHTHSCVSLVTRSLSCSVSPPHFDVDSSVSVCFHVLLSVCMNISRYESTSSQTLSDSCHTGWPPLFQPVKMADTQVDEVCCLPA